MRHLICDPRGNPVYTSFGSWRTYNGNANASYYNPRSILFLHVKSSEWDSVIHRAKTHPQEIMMVDDNGNTPLHIACQHDPPIEVLFSLKEAVVKTNSWGGTPLHIAASHRCNAEALKKLIDFFPGALSRLSRMCRTPIHYACMSYRGLDLVAFQVLLEQTLAESHRLREEHQQYLYHHRGRTERNAECDMKISNFIDVIRETTEDFSGDMLDDEEISLLMNDNDSLCAIADSSSGLGFVSSSENVGSTKTDGGKADERIASNGPNEDNYNVVTWKDSTGKTPLGLLFRRYRERVKRVIEILEQLKNSGTSSLHSSSSLQTDLGHLWGKARLVVVRLSEECQQLQQQQRQHCYRQLSSSATNTLKGVTAVGTSDESDDESSDSGLHWSLAASWSKEQFSNCSQIQEISKFKVDHAFEVAKERQFRIVHASVGLTGYGCPPEMIKLAISIYPNQVREMDEDGNLPLHIAATASSFKTTSSTNGVMDEDSSVFSDSIVSLFSSGSTRKNGNDGSGNASFDKVIRLLLKRYPQAAQTPHGRSGRLPLVLADRAGDRTWNDGMKTLLRAYPPALFSGSKGIISVKLYPHVLSLIGGGDPTLPYQARNVPNANANANATLSSQRTCPSNRFKGHGGMSLLHNLLLLKQRHMRERMAGTSVTSKENGKHCIAGRPFIPTNSDFTRVSSTNQGLFDHEDLTHTGERSHATRKNSLTSSSQSSKCNNCTMRGVDRKARKEYATTMFELLRAKPDLIEVTRSHQVNLKSDLQRGVRNTRKMSLATHGSDSNICSHQFRAPQYQQFSKGRKIITSRNFLERMRVFERKTWKSGQHISD
mmetsp:Transcript_11621/g.27268  ORF Transcript_11621/g.27268 Transcript_11621/m.27268 type:complete len:828 (-) Transcript_11621:280-2763(-)